MANNKDADFKVGDRVYIKPYSVPGHEKPAGSGTIVSISYSSIFPMATVIDRNGSSSLQWFHHLTK